MHLRKSAHSEAPLADQGVVLDSGHCAFIVLPCGNDYERTQHGHVWSIVVGAGGRASVG